jgi:DNA mismatch endonuclease, patch repair protein
VIMDVLTKQQRSYNMSRIKARDTKPEITLRRFLRSKGVRGYRIRTNLPGRPDIVFPKNKVAVFVDGCFWHRCPKCFVKPATRRDFWMKKISGNEKRDSAVNIELEAKGWKIIRIWEHEIRKNPAEAADRILSELGSQRKP